MLIDIRFTLDQIGMMILQCEDAARELFNQAKPPDFEPTRVARSILLKAIEHVDRCQYMSDRELLKFRGDMKRAAKRAQQMLLEQHEIVLSEFSYYNNPEKPQ